LKKNDLKNFSFNILRFIVIAQPMEGHPQITCKGLTANKKLCNRNTNLNLNGYCYQHAAQFLPPQDADVVEAGIHDGASSEQDHSSSSSSSTLPRCSATSRSTHQQCKHHVSVLGENFCSFHGGKQKSTKLPSLAQCEGVSKRTRNQCLLHVSLAGERFCPAHGGKAKRPSVQKNVLQGGAAVAVAASMAAGAGGGRVIRWHALLADILTYVLELHPQHCHCSANNRCQSMKVIDWLKNLAVLCCRNGNPQPDVETIVQWMQSDDHIASVANVNTIFLMINLLTRASTSSLAAAAAAAMPGTPPPMNPSPLPNLSPSILDDLDSDYLFSLPRASNNNNNNND
jgi:hypothetical protein